MLKGSFLIKLSSQKLAVVCFAFVIAVSGYTKAAEVTEAVPHGVQELRQAAKECSKTGDSAGAREKHQQIIRTFPDTDYAMGAQRSIVCGYLLANDMTLAATEMDTLLDIYRQQPDYAKAVQGLAGKFCARKNFAKGVKVYDVLLTQFPRYEQIVSVHRSKITAYLALGETVKAEAEVDSFFANHQGQPEFVYYAYLLGRRFMLSGHPETALDIHSRMLSEFPAHEQRARTQCAKITTYLSMDKSAAAEAEVEVLFAKYSESPEFVKYAYELGGLFYKKKHTDKAMEIYDRLLSQFPKAPQNGLIRCSKMKADLAAGKIAEAEAEVAPVFANAQDCPGFVETAHELGRRFRNAGSPAKALEIYNGLLSQFPDHACGSRIQCSKIGTYLAMGDAAQAESGVDVLFAKYSDCPGFVEHVCKLGVPFKNKKRFATTLKICAHLLSAFPEDTQGVSVQFLKTSTCLAMGDTAQAKAGVEVLFSKYSDYPGFIDNAHRLGRQFSKREQYNEALDIYDRLLSRFPTHERAIRIQSSKIDSYLAMGDQAQADVEVDVLLSNYSKHKDYVSVAHKVARKLCGKGDTGKGLEIYTRLMREYPEHKAAVHIQAGIVKCYLEMGAAGQVDKPLGMLLEKYATNPAYAKVVNGTAEAFRQHKHYAKAIELYQTVLAQKPAAGLEMGAYAGMAKGQIQGSGVLTDPNSMLASTVACPDVDTIVGVLVSTYKDEKRTGYHVFQIAEEYYFRAERALKDKDTARANADFQKAIIIWKNINQIEDSKHRAMATYFSGVAYQSTKHFEDAANHYQKLADEYPDYDRRWHALSMVAECYSILKNQGKVPKDISDEKIFKAYKQLVENYPDSPASRVAKKLVEGKFESLTLIAFVNVIYLEEQISGLKGKE